MERYSVAVYCFLNQSCFSRASGAIRGSLPFFSQRHSSLLRLAPQWGQSPRQSLEQITFIGSARFTCSASTSARNRPSPSKKADLRIIQIQLEFFVPGDRGHGPVEKVEIAADFLDHRVQAARADQLDPRVQVADDADLAFHQLRRGADFQRLHLPEFAGMEIQRPRGVAFPDAGFPYGEFVHIQKHEFPRVFSSRKAIICPPLAYVKEAAQAMCRALTPKKKRRFLPKIRCGPTRWSRA